MSMSIFSVSLGIVLSLSIIPFIIAFKTCLLNDVIKG